MSDAARRLMLMLATLLLTAATVNAEDDPYAAWSQGRPRDAAPLLHRAALASREWGAWYDCALAASAAGDAGAAAAWMLEAHRLAPARPEPLRALRANGAAIPPTWNERLGPIAWLGAGWQGLAASLVVGLACGWWLASRRHRPALVVLAGALLGAMLPGAFASWADANAAWVAAVRDTHLVDSTGTPGRALAAGTVVMREPQRPWNDRVLVRLEDGQRGYMILADTITDP
jgi:hypothetical protein